MAFARYNLTITDDSGNVVDGASVEVRHETVGAPLATLYADRDGTTPLGNPYTASDGGDAGFFVGGGAYRVTITSASVSRDWRYVAVGTGQETDNSAIRPGALYQWDTGTTDADPGDGNIRANNASLASATFLYIDDISHGNSNLEAFLLSFDDSTNGVKGDLVLVDLSLDTSATFKITTVTDAAGYVKIGVGNHSGETSFTAGAEIGVQFFRAGDAGAAAGEVTQRLQSVTPHEFLEIIWASNSTVDIDATAVTLFNGSGAAKRFTTLNETLDIAASGANGLDTGAEGASRWYYIWGIGKTDGTLDGLLSESNSAPTLPAGYDYKGLLGCVRNNGSSNFVTFRQLGRDVQMDVSGILSAGSATSFTAVDLSTAAPPFATQIKINAFLFSSSGAQDLQGFVTSHGSTTTSTYGGTPQLLGNLGTFGVGTPIEVPIDWANSRIVYRVAGTNARLSINSTGYRY